MKKQLLATTALVAGGVAAMSAAGEARAADPIKLSLGGYVTTGLTVRSQNNVTAGAADDDRVLPTNAQGVPVTTDIGRSDVFWEGEVHFDGETKLDNGIKIGVNIQLEAYTSNDQIDEHYIFLDGGFGRLVVGAENSAMYLMHYAAPSPTGGDFGADSPNFVPFRAPGNNATGSVRTFSQLTNDANKITYYTPRFAPGFQFGLSYTPDDDAFAGYQRVGVGGGVGCGGGCSFNAGNNVSDNDAGGGGTGSNYHHFVEAGMNFVKSINGVELAFDVGFGTGFVEKQLRETNDRTLKQRYAAGAGFNVGFSGFTVGGAVLWDNQGLQGQNERWDFSLGAMYGAGPWLVGLNGGYAVVQDGRRVVNGRYNRRSNDTLIYVELGGSYTLGDGVKAFSTINYANFSGNGTSNEEATGVAWSTGLALSF
jgi:predicted porin